MRVSSQLAAAAAALDFLLIVDTSETVALRNACVTSFMNECRLLAIACGAAIAVQTLLLTDTFMRVLNPAQFQFKFDE